MKQELNLKFLTIAAIAIISTAVCSVFLFYRILVEQIYGDLEAATEMAVFTGIEKHTPEMDTQTSQDGFRITLIDAEGRVIFDSMAMEGDMENHRARPEFEQAFRTGTGRAVRRSATSAVHTFYYARRLPDGNALRVGKASRSVDRLIWMVSLLILCIGISIFILCVFFAKRLARQIVGPIEKMAQNLIQVEEADVYEEMRPFISMIKRQHMDIVDYARVRQEFTANVSHELKTPLTAISGYAELITSGMAGGPDTGHFAGEIYRCAERLQALINDIIKLAQLDDTSLKLEFEVLDLYEMGKECIDSMQMQAAKNEITLRLEGESVSINGNKVLIEELLYNLCSNGIRYNKRTGTVTVRTAMEQGRPVLTVQDTGIGIPHSQQERVFERFYRVDKSRSKSTGGTGLGLAIVKHIVARHDAQIELTSEEGEGTRIRILF